MAVLFEVVRVLTVAAGAVLAQGEVIILIIVTIANRSFGSLLFCRSRAVGRGRGYDRLSIVLVAVASVLCRIGCSGFAGQSTIIITVVALEDQTLLLQQTDDFGRRGLLQGWWFIGLAVVGPCNINSFAHKGREPWIESVTQFLEFVGDNCAHFGWFVALSVRETSADRERAIIRCLDFQMAHPMRVLTGPLLNAHNNCFFVKEGLDLE